MGLDSAGHNKVEINSVWFLVRSYGEKTELCWQRKCSFIYGLRMWPSHAIKWKQIDLAFYCLVYVRVVETTFSMYVVGNKSFLKLIEHSACQIVMCPCLKQLETCSVPVKLLRDKDGLKFLTIGCWTDLVVNQGLGCNLQTSFELAVEVKDPIAETPGREKESDE